MTPATISFAVRAYHSASQERCLHGNQYISREFLSAGLMLPVAGAASKINLLDSPDKPDAGRSPGHPR